MENVFNISELIRKKQQRASKAPKRPTGVGYTCPKTGVVFPPIQCFQLPQGYAKDFGVIFDGTYVPHYQLSLEVRPSNAFMMGIEQGPPEEVTCLGSNAEVAIEIFHFPNEEQAEGFFKATSHFLGDFDEVESFSNEKGHFFMITTMNSLVKKGTVSYVTYHRSYVPALEEELEVRVVATIDARGNLQQTLG